jgi:hypothetical protein
MQKDVDAVYLDVPLVAQTRNDNGTCKCTSKDSGDDEDFALHEV